MTLQPVLLSIWLFVLFCSASTALATPVANAVRLDEAPTLDGQVLADEVWTQPALSGFWQQRPTEGAPSSQKTEVFIGYTDTTLYVAVIAYDEDPSGIIVAESRRDASLDNG
ncbi:MAG: hypothetical protein P8Q28_04480, partial [Luminiphilus sp.]|nr:hypothetical protein [Luminiphilus sp.]